MGRIVRTIWVMERFRLGVKLWRLFIVGVLAAGYSASEATAETWRILRVDNVEIVSNLSERNLKHVHREIFYFNRAMEAMFGKKYVNQTEPLLALVLRRKSDMEEFLGDRADRLGGVFLPHPGFEMFLARRVGRGIDVQQILFHELTHRNLNPLDPPTWLNEGVAELFETIEVKQKTARIGSANPHWVNYHNWQAKFYKVGFDEFFAMTESAEHYSDGKKSTDFYAKAWLFAHYCWFGESSLKPAYLKLASEPGIDEARFVELFGYGYEELESNLRGYARRGRYHMLELDLKELPPLPEPDIQVAEPNLWRNFHARAHFLNGNHSTARDLASGVPSDDPHRLMAVETLVAVNSVEGLHSEADRYLEEAERLGTRNTMLRTLIVGRRLDAIREERGRQDPVLPREIAVELMEDLAPSLRLHRQNPRAVMIAISIFDLANAFAPDFFMEIFSIWEAAHGRSSPRTLAALNRIRERQASLTPAAE